MKVRSLAFAALIAASPFLLGMGGGPDLRDTRFSVTDVDISGPNTIPNGSSRSYTVEVTIDRDVPQNDRIDGTGSRPIRPSIRAGSTQLTFAEVDFPRNANSVSVSLTLNCTNGEVRGSQGGTWRGSPFMGIDMPAEVRGALNEKRSGVKQIRCTA